MSVAYSPKIINDGLVLSLDFGNEKSWRGQPTTNLLSNPWCDGGNAPSPMTFNGFECTNTVVSALPGGRVMSSLSPFWAQCVKNNASNGRVMFLGLGGLSTGVNYVFSFYVYSDDPNLTSLTPGTDNSANSPMVSNTTYTSADRNSVKRIFIVFTSTAGAQTIGIRVNAGAPIGTTFYLTGFQVERQDAMTPVANTVRSTSQAIFDQTRTYTATLAGSNFTYPNPLGGLTVNNVNDSYVDITPATNLRMGTSNFTLAAWVKQNDSGFNIITEARGTGLLGYFFVLNYPSSGQMCLFVNKDGTQNVYAINPTIALSTTVPQYLVVVARRNSGVLSFYNNGQLVGTTTGVHFNSISPSGGDIHRLGYDLGGSTTNMTFYSYQVYNRALSNEEVLQNYNTSRSRFT